jgi:serine/threonine protein kinase
MYIIPEFVPEGPKRLIRKMLQIDASKRPIPSELLKDEWIETGLSEVPQPDPPKVASDSSVHETDLLESLVSANAGQIGVC